MKCELFKDGRGVTCLELVNDSRQRLVLDGPEIADLIRFLKEKEKKG